MCSRSASEEEKWGTSEIGEELAGKRNALHCTGWKNHPVRQGFWVQALVAHTPVDVVRMASTAATLPKNVSIVLARWAKLCISPDQAV